MRILAKLVFGAAVAATAAALLPAQAAPAPVAPDGVPATVPSGILAQLNEIRVAHGLAPVRISTALSAAADRHAEDMVSKGFFEHDSADGLPFWKRIARYYPPASYRAWSVGENLLWAHGALDARRALKVWMASPGHRANILSPRWREIGIAVLYETAAPGAFGGSSVTVVATDFGFRV